MKPSDFERSIEFDNLFIMMDFCKKYHLTYDNSLLIESEEEDGVYILYYN